MTECFLLQDDFKWLLFLPANQPREIKWHPTDRTMDILANRGIAYIKVCNSGLHSG